MSSKTKITAALTLALSLGLTACSTGDAPEAPVAPQQTVTQDVTATETKAAEKPAPTSTSPLSLQPTSEPTAEKHVMTEADKDMREGLNTPLSVNLEEAFQTYADPMVKQVFPDQEYAMEGARFAMTFLNDLTTIGNLYEKRDGSKDFELLNTADITGRMDAEFVEQLKTAIDKEGRFDWIPTAYADGTIGYHKPVAGGEKILMTLSSLPVSTYNTPALTVSDEGEAGDALTVHGQREIQWFTAEGYTATQETTYWISVVPSGDSWAVTNLGWKQTGSHVGKTGESK